MNLDAPPSLFYQAWRRLVATADCPGAVAAVRARMKRPSAKLPWREMVLACSEWLREVQRESDRRATRSPKRDPSERSRLIHVGYDPELEMTAVVRRDGYQFRTEQFREHVTIYRDYHGDVLGLMVHGEPVSSAARLVRQVAEREGSPDLALAARWLSTGVSVVLRPKVRRRPKTSRRRGERRFAL